VKLAVTTPKQPAGTLLPTRRPVLLGNPARAASALAENLPVLRSIFRAPRVAPRRGFVLLAVLVFIMLISMVTVSLLFRSRAEETAASASAGSEQAWAAAFSGVQEALRVAAAKSGAGEWMDNPAAFRERLVFEDGSDRWLFTVFSPGDSEALTEVRYGLTDEASRVNLNQPGGADLAKIPRMTAAMVQSLRQYLGQSTNDTATTPEPETVPTLPTDVTEPLPPLDPLGELMDIPDTDSLVSSLLGFRPRGPLATLDELLRVPGFSRELLFGEDANFNGRLDPNENDGDEKLPPDNRDGRLDHGMAQYFTVTAYDPERTSTGQLKVDLNNPAEPLPATDLPPAFTNYVAALRTAKVKLAHPVDLLDATMKVKDAQGQEVEVASGITKEELPKVLDLFATDWEGRREGLININTASAIVLATLPGVELSLAETIVSARPGLRAEQRATPAWLLTDGLVDVPTFKRIAPQLTAQSYQFSFHVIGYAVPSGRYRVLDVTIDVAGNEPRITSLRDITRLGLPFNLQSETLEQTTPGTAYSPPTVSPFRKPTHG
jgi:type II secretory pathway component PulK